MKDATNISSDMKNLLTLGNSVSSEILLLIWLQEATSTKT